MKSLTKLLGRDSRLRFRVDHELERVLHLRGNLAQLRSSAARTVRSAGMRLVKQYPDLFGRIDPKGMEVALEAPDANGGTSVTLQQFHGRARVEGGSIRFHANKRRVLDTVRNRLYSDLARVPRRPRVKSERAAKSLMAKTKARKATVQEAELVVYRHDGTPRLSWKVTLADTKKGAHGAAALWVGYVDALNGRVLHFYDNIQTAGPSTGSGTGVYSGAGNVASWFTDTTYQLRDTTRSATGGPEIITDDEDGAAPSEDADNNWDVASTTPRHDHQGAEVDAHRFAGDVIDYFQTVHGRNSFDDAGADVLITSHFGTDYNNGFWNGTRVSLGDGDGVAFDYLTSDDWLAHEITHAYTQHTCGLVYQDESGALNEAFSDIFSAFITGDWLVFEDSWLSTTAPATRNMIEPTNGGNWDNSSDTNAFNSVIAGHQPSHYDDRYTGTWNNGGVHMNSGIINHLFYLLTIGGTHAISGITVTGIGQTAAEQLLFRCMAVNLVGQPNATFLDFREAMLDAVLDIFPTDLTMLSQVKRAFNAVGIGPDIYVRDNLADTGEEPYGGSYLWASPDVINRQAASANPAVDFADMTDDSLWQNVEAGQDNFVYVRLQNRGNADGDATINVYFVSASTFGTPASWISIGALAETAIAPGEVRIAGPLPFPSALIPGIGHYCMIAVVSDPLDPAPDHTLITSTTEFVDYVRNTNNMAYRNMDVVDLIPGGSGTLTADVQSLGGAREPYAIRLDLGRFVPGARVRVRIPARAGRGAIPIGMKLVARRKSEDIYEVMNGRRLEKHLHFLRRDRGVFAPGFERILVERDFKIRVEYLLPPAKAFGKRLPRDGYKIALRQEWNGEAIGAVGHHLVPPRKKEGRSRKPRAKA